MCGITGIFILNGEPVSSVVLCKMIDAIAHRGLDEEGFFIDSFIGFGTDDWPSLICRQLDISR